MSMGQYYSAPYQYGYQAPYLTPYAPMEYTGYGLMPIRRQAYSERFQSYWLQPIDESYMPDTAIPGFQGLGALAGIPTWALIAGGAALYFFVLRKK